MTHGGYQIIDLKNTTLKVGTGTKIDGVYNKIKSTRKAIFISGLNVGGTEYHDTFVELTVSGTNFTGTIYGKTITISNADLVTISA